MALVLTEHKNHPSLHLPSRPLGANTLLVVSGSSLGNKFWEGYFCGGTWLWNELRKNTCWVGRKWNWTERNVLWCSYIIDFCSEAETELKRSLNPNQQAGSLRSLRTSWWMWAAQRRAITLEKVALSGWGHFFLWALSLHSWRKEEIILEEKTGRRPQHSLQWLLSASLAFCWFF